MLDAVNPIGGFMRPKSNKNNKKEQNEKDTENKTNSRKWSI